MDDARFASVRESLDAGDYVRAETDAASLRSSLVHAPAPPLRS